MSIHAVIQKPLRITDPAIEEEIRTPLCFSESLGHFFGAAIMNEAGTGAADLTGASVTANFIRGDGIYGTVNGTVSGNVAYVVLPSWCYRATGRFTLTVFLNLGTASRAIIIARGRVMADTTDTAIDPEHIIPSIAELLAQISACISATEAASTAASNANTKAGLADTAASNANSKASAADTAASAANTAASAANTAASNADAKAALANTAAGTANTAASNADAKAALANTAAGTANTAAGTANTAAGNANAAASKINDMTVSASGLSAGSAPTAAISEVSGHKNIAFGIPKGDKGDTGNTGNGIASVTLNSDYTLTIVFTDGTSTTTGSVRGQQGEQGIQGPTGANAAITQTAVAYQNSASGTTVPSGEWSSAQPITPQGQFLWTKTTLTWNNGQSTVLYSVSRQGVDGTGSVVSVNEISPDANGNVTLPIDSAPTENSTNPVTSGGTYTALAGKQNTLTFDDAPTAGSNNPVKSSGIKTALDGKKSTQSAVTDPTASGTALAFIDTISQDAQGVITPTKKTVQSASQSQAGLMSAADKTKLNGLPASAAVPGSIAIIVDGDTAGTAVAPGAYAYIKNNTHGLSEGLYKNKSSSAFPTSGSTADSTVFEAVPGGGINSLLANLNDRVYCHIDSAWKDAPLGFSLYYYESPTADQTFDLPYPFCVVVVYKQKSARGVAIAYRWDWGSTVVFKNDLHDTWRGWRRTDCGGLVRERYVIQGTLPAEGQSAVIESQTFSKTGYTPIMYSITPGSYMDCAIFHAGNITISNNAISTGLINIRNVTGLFPGSAAEFNLDVLYTPA